MTIIPGPHRKPLFAVGKIVSTPGALEATNDLQRLIYLGRHVTGDFGCVCPEDAETNRQGIEHGDRIVSACPIDPSRPSKGYGENTLWIITEADLDGIMRSALTRTLQKQCGHA